MSAEHFDVLIVGAGLSGIGAAYHLQTRCPDRSYAILEARGAIGGTWDLFRYPGIRSDSDMYTLGYAFRPWTDAKAIADGKTIRDYIVSTAAMHGIDRHIRFRQRVTSAAWDSGDARWTVTVDGPEGPMRFTCGFLYTCSGYYDYARGYTPDWPGTADFGGRIVHPQFWPDDLDYAGKRVVVIGSGATAVTLVPALAETAAHVTMLQRSPSYVVAQPGKDLAANRLRTWLPETMAYALTRWRKVLLQMLFFYLARRSPARAKRQLLGMVQGELGAQYDVATHFTPRYDPWDQRLCIVPDGDLFAAIRAGRARVVTDRIVRFTADGLALESGEILPADIVVTATGLELQVLGNIALTIDGVPVDLAQTYNYKGMMFSDVPNLAAAFGYTNASWTLKADLTSAYVCRLLNTMKRRGLRQATPRTGTARLAARPFLDFTSGYVTRAMAQFPKQGDRAPWRVHQNYARDLLALRFGSVDDAMEYSNPTPASDISFH